MPSRLELRLRHRALVFHYTDRHAPKGPSQLIGTWAKGFVTLLPPSTTTILSPPSSLLFFGEEAIYSKMMMTGKYSISFLFKEKWKKKLIKRTLAKRREEEQVIQLRLYCSSCTLRMMAGLIISPLFEQQCRCCRCCCYRCCRCCCYRCCHGLLIATVAPYYYVALVNVCE